MKKVLIAALLLIGTQGVFAQTNEGQWLVGGNAGFNSSKEGEFKTSTFTLSPNAGYFFMDNFAGGLRVNLASMTEKFGDAKNTTSGFSIAPFVRYYFVSLGDNVKLFGDAAFAFGSEKYKEEGEDDQKANFTNWGISAGPAVFLTPNTALEFTVGYSNKKYKDAEDGMGNFGVNVGFQIHLGNGKK